MVLQTLSDKHMEKRNCVTESILNELEDNKEYYVSVSTVDRNNKIDTISNTK